MAGVKDLPSLLKSLEPVLRPGNFAFITRKQVDQALLTQALVVVKEEEGITLVVPADGQEHGPNDYLAQCITLTVHSDLAAVGLTAAVATALAQANISCNIVAGFYHDHLFVSAGDGERAVEVLQKLAESYGSR